MKKRLLIITSSSLMLVIFLAIFLACQKEGAITNSQEKSVSIPFFKSGDEYVGLRNKVFSFSYQELKAYEESKGYKSFGRACEELYYSIDPKSFTSIDQIKQYVEKHKEYLQLIEGSDGELTLEVVDYRNPYRYFINNDKMFQIDNVVYKAIGDFLASTAIDNITKLKTINVENISSFENDPKVHLMNYRKTDLPNKLKDVAYNCGNNPGDGSVTNGKERTVTHLDIYMEDILWVGTVLYSHYLVRPYHKVLFIWYWCDRDLYADIDVAQDYYINAWTRIFGSVTINFDSVVEQKLEQEVGYSYVCYPDYCTHTYHYGGYNFKADSNTTDQITISCHPELF